MTESEDNTTTHGLTEATQEAGNHLDQEEKAVLSSETPTGVEIFYQYCQDLIDFIVAKEQGIDYGVIQFEDGTSLEVRPPNQYEIAQKLRNEYRDSKKRREDFQFHFRDVKIESTYTGEHDMTVDDRIAIFAGMIKENVFTKDLWNFFPELSTKVDKVLDTIPGSLTISVFELREMSSILFNAHPDYNPDEITIIDRTNQRFSEILEKKEIISKLLDLFIPDKQKFWSQIAILAKSSNNEEIITTIEQILQELLDTAKFAYFARLVGFNLPNRGHLFYPQFYGSSLNELIPLVQSQNEELLGESSIAKLFSTRVEYSRVRVGSYRDQIENLSGKEAKQAQLDYFLALYATLQLFYDRNKKT